MDIVAETRGIKQGTKRKDNFFDPSEKKTKYGPAGNLTNQEDAMVREKMETNAPSGMTRDQFMSALKSKGYFPNTKAKDAFEALLDNKTFKEAKIDETIGYLPDLSKLSIGGGRKQRGGKKCDYTDYAILMAMMAVLYWTGAIPAAATAAYITGSTYMPDINTITTTMETCASYLSALVPSAFPVNEIGDAFSAVGKTFVRKVGELLIILAEAANLSLKLNFSVGAKTIWDTTINWVKDNPTYVLTGYAGKIAIGWRADALELKKIKDKEAAAPKALTSDEVKTYKKVFGDIIYRIRDLLCDLTDLIRNGAATAADISVVGIAKVRSPSDATATTATTGTNTDGDPDSIEEIKTDLGLLKGLADAAAAAEPLASPLASGGKRSTRKRNGRTRKPKSRKPKKRKSSGRKAKKASRKMKSRNGRKTRRRGSKKR